MFTAMSQILPTDHMLIYPTGKQMGGRFLGPGDAALFRGMADRDTRHFRGYQGVNSVSA